MKLAVNKHVLIPRPETEELVEWVIETLKEWPQKTDRQYKMLDVGTGSGCIAIALQKNLPAYFESWACDINDEALTVARKNADDNKALVDFIQLDLLDEHQRKQLPHIDVIVSNPPYIPQKEKEKMQDNVVQYEPSMALFVPDNDPLQFYKALIAFGKEKLQSGGYLFVDVHENYGTETKELIETAGYKEVEMKKDLQGKHRMIRARKSN
jgi:release factor glutamine methyltransferase